MFKKTLLEVVCLISSRILPLLPFRPLLPLAGLGLGLAAPLAGLATGGAIAAGSAIGGFWDGVRNGFGDDDDDDYYYYY